MTRKLLIIGYGSAGRRFAKIAKEKFKNLDVYIFTKQKKIGFRIVKNFTEIKKINPEFIVISSPTSQHFKHLKLINNHFKNKYILVEKPLFNKFQNIRNLKNKVFVGFNLRNLKIIQFLKTFVKKNKKNIYEISFINHSSLIGWRKNLNYKDSSSAKKKLGGGVILDCSHELDFASWILGKIKLIFVNTSNNSKLNIETEDHCKIFGKYNDINVHFDFNYYSNYKQRKIIIIGEDFTADIDLILAKISIFKKKKIIIKKFGRNDIKNSYFLELKNLINKKKKNLTSYKSALATQKFINNIQNF